MPKSAPLLCCMECAAAARGTDRPPWDGRCRREGRRHRASSPGTACSTTISEDWAVAMVASRSRTRVRIMAGERLADFSATKHVEAGVLTCLPKYLHRFHTSVTEVARTGEDTCRYAVLVYRFGLLSAIRFLIVSHEVRGRHVFGLFFAAGTDVNLAGFGFCLRPPPGKGTVCKDGALSRILGVHLFVYGHRHERAPGSFNCAATLLAYFAWRSAMGIITACTGDRAHRERASVVFDQHAEETLNRSVERAVHHDRLFT